MGGVTFKLTGEVLYEPRANQLTHETVRESLRDALRKETLHPTVRTYYEEALERAVNEPQRVGVAADGERYTRLTMRVDDTGQRVEVTATGKLADRIAAETTPGDRIAVAGMVTGTVPHYYLRAKSIRATS